MRIRCCVMCCAGLLLAGATAVSAEQSADEMFADLFGNEFGRAMETTGTEDNLILARRMLEIAPEVTEKPALFELVCQRIYELTNQVTTGYDIALASQKLLAEKSPKLQRTALKNIIDIRQRICSTLRGEPRNEATEQLIAAIMDAANYEQDHEQFAQAIPHLRRAQTLATSIRSDLRDQIQQQFLDISNQLRRMQEADQLREKLEQNPGDQTTARQLVQLYLVEMDEPAKAGLYMLHFEDETLRDNLMRACKVPDQQTESDLLQLSDWYFKLAEKAPTDARVNMYQRAVNYLNRYLARHSEQDVNRMKAELQLKHASDQLEKLAPKATKQSWSTGVAFAVTFEKNTIKQIEDKWYYTDVLNGEQKMQMHGVKPAAGVFGQAAHLNEESSFINTNINAATTYHTFAFWAKADITTSTSGKDCMMLGIVREANRMYFGYNNTLLALGYVDKMWGEQASALKIDTAWHFYTFVRNPDKGQVYRDGKLILTKPGSPKPDGSFYLGACNKDAENTADYFFNGLFDDFAVWTRPLTERQVADLYRYAKSGKSYCELLQKLSK